MRKLTTLVYSGVKLVLPLLLIIIILEGCRNEYQNSPYSFFVAGHVYGNVGSDNIGVHPPFADKFNLITSDSTIELGFFTGDIVNKPSKKNWDEIDSVISVLGIPVHKAVGNHDMRNRELYESRYGKTWYSFKHKDDFFIILDPNLDHWNILGEQLEFLKNTLSQNAAFSNNVFVFVHQMIWWTYDKYGKVRINSHEGKGKQLNFWTEIEPLFHKLNNEVFMFCGDFGAANWSDDVMYDHYDNMHLIGSGMGEGIGDNFLLIKVQENKKVNVEIISLNKQKIDDMGVLSDYLYK